MKIEDLRIGDIIFSEYNEPFTKVDLEFLNTFDMVKCWGVPIDEKILLQCGFYKENNYTSNDNVFVKEIHFPSFFTIVEEEKGYKLCDADIYTNIIYLHELQNLYYVLTKKELEINIDTLEL